MIYSQPPNSSAQSAARLESWREHPHAPRWNLNCGDQLNDVRLQTVRDFAAHLAHSDQRAEDLPSWMSEFVAHCARQVPFYRARLGQFDDKNALQVLAGPNWENVWKKIGFCSRADLAREVWHFVPDDLSLREVNVYWTSGTTGSEVMIPAAPQWASFYLPLYERAMNLAGALENSFWPRDNNRVAFATIAAQQHTFTYASTSLYLEESVAMKVNLHPSQWRAPADAVAFLNAANPQVLAGDPVSLQVLAAGDFDITPLAIFSAALQLTPRLRDLLQARFDCPIIDFYSSNETGPLACCYDGTNWQLLNADSWLEIVRDDGTRCELGERGEIVVSTRCNQFLPLLRYRTGDFACWQHSENGAVLRDFEGRAPVTFRASEQVINSIDVTHALRDLVLNEFSLHQNADESLRFQFRGVADEDEIRAALQTLFAKQDLHIERVDDWPRDNRKMLRYSSDLV